MALAAGTENMWTGPHQARSSAALGPCRSTALQAHLGLVSCNPTGAGVAGAGGGRTGRAGAGRGGGARLRSARQGRRERRRRRHILTLASPRVTRRASDATLRERRRMGLMEKEE